MNNGWKECKLGEICTDISYGFTESANFEAVGPKFLRITDIVPNIINWDTVPYCVADKQVVDKYKLQNGDIVIARTGATTGYNKIIKNIDFDAIFASYLIRYKIDTTKAYPQYIGHILQSSTWYDYIDAIAGGSAQPGANAKELGSFGILLPPLSEQRAIAGVLSSLDDKIDLLHRQNKTLEGMAEALWRKMFVEEADSGWHNGKLGDIADINPLRSIKKGTSATYLDMSNMPTAGPFPKEWVQREYTSGIKFKNGDTIIARITPCLENGKTAYVNFLNHEEIAWGSTEYIVIAPKPGYCSEWYYFLARNDDFRDFAIQNMTGTSGRQRVSGDSIAEYELAIPPMNISEKYITFTGPVMEHIRQNSFQIRTLSRLRDTLLHKLMSGEVMVKA